MKGILRSFCLVAVLLAGALSARAQLTISIYGQAQNGTAGYDVGVGYEFTFELSNHYADNVVSSFNGTSNQWNEEDTGNDALFSSLIGSGLLGTYVRPVGGGFFDPYSYLQVTDVPHFSILAGADISSDIGLTTLDLTPIRFISAELTNVGGINFSNFTGYQTPESYFVNNGYLGSFSSADGNLQLRDSDNNLLEDFVIVNIAIAYTTPAVPEPSTYAAIAGVLALGLAAWRRKPGVLAVV